MKKWVVEIEKESGRVETRLVPARNKCTAISNCKNEGDTVLSCTAAAVLNIERGHDEFKLVDCKIKEMSESLFMLTLHSANIFNRQLSDWELTNGVAEFTKYLVKARESGELTIEGKMRDYIANVTGKSTGKINQINSINNNLCEEGKEAFKDGKINFSTAYETSRLPEEKQHEVIENGELLSKDVREMVKEEREKKEAEKKPGDDYEPAHPESITSLCYSCQYYSECNVKTGTCEKCDKYTNKAEAEKTEEQRYDEEQAAIDRDTKAKLRQQSDDKKMETLPSEATTAEPKTHIIRLAAMNYDDVVSGKPFYFPLHFVQSQKIHSNIKTHTTSCPLSTTFRRSYLP